MAIFIISAAIVLLATLIVFVGNQLGVGAQLSTAVIVVLGIRIFTNAAAVRRLHRLARHRRQALTALRLAMHLSPSLLVVVIALAYVPLYAVNLSL
jgi:hypothetical protein